MSKKKASKDPIVNLIRTFWSRKRAKRGFMFPKEYVLALSDKLWRMNPSKAIVYQTLTNVFCKGDVIGYTRRIDDARFFREKQEADFKKDWDAFKDSVDDLIHKKSNVQVA
jgi:hypothetical protein